MLPPDSGLISDAPLARQPALRSANLWLYLTDWNPVRWPGGLLAVLALVSTLILLPRGSYLAVLHCLVSVPIIAMSARRRSSIALYAGVFVALELLYWLIDGRHANGSERTVVIANAVSIVASLAHSWFFPYHYRARTPQEDWALDSNLGSCGLPVFFSTNGDMSDQRPATDDAV